MVADLPQVQRFGSGLTLVTTRRVAKVDPGALGLWFSDSPNAWFRSEPPL